MQIFPAVVVKIDESPTEGPACSEGTSCLAEIGEVSVAEVAEKGVARCQFVEYLNMVGWCSVGEYPSQNTLACR